MRRATIGFAAVRSGIPRCSRAAQTAGDLKEALWVYSEWRGDHGALWLIAAARHRATAA